MDDMELLEDFCAAEPPPEPQRLAMARSRLITAIGTDDSLGNRQTRWHRRVVLNWPWPAVAATTAGAAAVLTVAAIVAIPGSSRPTGSAKSGTQAGNWSAGTAVPSPRLAAYVLNRAAAAARATPIPRDNQFIYTDTRTAGPGVVSRIQSWQSVNGMRAGATRWTKCLVIRGRRVPHVRTQVLPSCLFKLPAGHGLNPIDRTYAGLRTLPTSPGAMLRWLERHNTCDGPAAFGLPKDIAAYAEIFMILDTVETPPPKIAAALFGAAAKIPGVSVRRSVTDAAGGNGIAVAMTFTVKPGPRTMYELIFNPRNYRYIGQQRFTMPSAQSPGTLLDAMTLIKSKVVNTAPTGYTTNGSAPTPSCV